jgi:exosome complex RNA-binding protein Csl4
LLSVVPLDVNVDLRHRETVDELSGISQLIADSVDEQMQENAMVFQYISAEKRAKLGNIIKELEKRLQDIKNVVRKDDEWLDVVTNIAETGQHLVRAVAAIEAEQWAVAIPELRDGMTGLASLLTYGYLITPFVDDSGVKAALADAQQALRDFDKEVSKIVEDSISLQSNNLEKLVSSRRQQWIRRAQKSFEFGDLLRAIVLDYLQRPNEGIAAVKENVGVVERSLNRLDPAAGTLHIQPWRDACLVQAPVDFSTPSGIMGCVSVHALAQTPSAVMSNEDRLGRFPLLVLDAGRRAFAVSFGYVFDRRDVEQIPLRSNPIPAQPR